MKVVFKLRNDFKDIEFCSIDQKIEVATKIGAEGENFRIITAHAGATNFIITISNHNPDNPFETINIDLASMLVYKIPDEHEQTVNLFTKSVI